MYWYGAGSGYPPSGIAFLGDLSLSGQRRCSKAAKITNATADPKFLRIGEPIATVPHLCSLAAAHVWDDPMHPLLGLPTQVGYGGNGSPIPGNLGSAIASLSWLPCYTDAGRLSDKIARRNTRRRVVDPAPYQYTVEFGNDPGRPDRGECAKLCGLLQIAPQPGRYKRTGIYYSPQTGATPGRSGFILPPACYMSYILLPGQGAGSGV